MRNEQCWLCRRTLEAGEDSLVRYRDQRGTCHPWSDGCGRWRAEYMLLSDEEIARFRRCVAQNDPMVYEDEYDVDKLIPRTFLT